MTTRPLLGSTVRLDLGSNVKEGVVVGYEDRTDNPIHRIVVEVTPPASEERHTISLREDTASLEVIDVPPRGSMAIVDSGAQRARLVHVAPNRRSAVAWLKVNHPKWGDDASTDISVRPVWPDEPAWTRPVPFDLVPDWESEGFRTMRNGTTGIPIGDDHPGAFAYRRRNHTHEGVDIYVPEGTPVSTVEAGRVVSVIPFTGDIAVPPSPFWHDTWAVLVEGASGTVVYGEVDGVTVSPGDELRAGTVVGRVRQVLVKDKVPPRPKCMLHLELHRGRVDDAYEWPVDGPRPESLLDPTEMLLSICMPG